MSLTVAVKFCGNCNPEISGGELLRKIKDEAALVLTMVQFVSWESPADVLLVISGCPVDCAARPQHIHREIVVAGESVNTVACGAEEISSRVVKLLNSLLLSQT